MYHILKYSLFYFGCITCSRSVFANDPINREALVTRHNVVITKADSLSSLSVGNGAFAFTVDVTGLQSFPDFYRKGVCLGTQSEWGWHSFPNTGHYRFEESLKAYALHGRTISYAVQLKQPERNKEAGDYFRQNLHRLQLGNIGFDITKKDGTPAGIGDVKNIRQELNVWTGLITSHFTIEGVPVDVVTCAHQTNDLIAVKVTSALVTEHRLAIRLRLPYPTGQFADAGNNWMDNEKHVSSPVSQLPTGATVVHRLDTTSYFITMAWGRKSIAFTRKDLHYFLLRPAGTSATMEVSFLFSNHLPSSAIPSFEETGANSMQAWKAFWSRGGAVDLSGSTDPRAFELERRIVLSQYLTKIQCAGHYPPQETGLTYNSWYGKPHLEMHWWHAVHYALWNRTDLLEKSLDWYATVQNGARAIAKRQGFDGVRWQKMTDNQGRESPSSVGAFLIWQQPHFIYMAELCYRNGHDRQVLNKYKDLVFATADFMASFPEYDKQKDRYNLGKGLIPAQECFEAVETFNPTYELNYWHWALTVAQQWRTRLGLPPVKKWNEVLLKLAPLPQQNGVYLATESTPDCYTTPRYKTDHPAVLGAFSTIPASNHLDTAVMHRTFDLVWKVWNWDKTWGWDFPLTAMAATRLHLPEKAVDALFMQIHTNTYLANGHNYQDERLTIYLPGNGGLLSAIAMMCAGYDGCKEDNPGFPKDGRWKVRWEGLNAMP